MSRNRVLSWSIRLVTVAGLGVDTGIHLALAPTQPPAGPGGWSQVDLFYAEAAVSLLAAFLVLVIGNRLSYTFALLVAASALAAVVLSRYVDLGPLGPLPDLYEPFWYPSKVAVTVAEAIAVVASAVAALLLRPRRPLPDERRG